MSGKAAKRRSLSLYRNQRKGINKEMKKKYIIVLLVFICIAIVLPFIIDWVYKLGENNPILTTKYSQSDILNYLITVIGIFISIIALIIALQTNDTFLSISLAQTDYNKKPCILIMLLNNSLFNCTVESFELTNHQHNYSCKLIHAAPEVIKAKSYKEYFIENDDLRQHRIIHINKQ